MNQFIKCPEIKLKLNGIEVSALVDSGSQVNALSDSWYQINKERLGNINILPMANTTVKAALGKSSKIVRIQIMLTIEIGNFQDDVIFLVIPGLNRDCILGISLLKLHNCVMNFEENKLIINQGNPKDEVKEKQEIVMHAVDVSNDVIDADFADAVKKITTINEKHKRQLMNVLKENAEVFREVPGRIVGYEHHIKVTDSTPFFQRSYPVPIALREKVDEEIKKMVSCNVIERSSGPFVNPLVTVIKKDKSVRLCLDARKINTVMLPDYEGSAQISDILASCNGIKILSSIDLKNSFWQVSLHRESRDFTGFMHRGRTYRFTVMPFGLKTSSASLARALDSALSEDVKKFTLIYVDDCLVISRSIEEHLDHLRALLENLKRANITVNFKKSQFFREEIKYLGFRISTAGITTDEEKIAAITNFPRPKNQRQLKSFLGLTNFYNRFSDKYAECTQPLLELLKKERKFRWTPELDQHFSNIKRLFVDTVVLKYPDTSKKYYLQTDASKYALGGQLYQYDDDNNIAVVAYTSRTFKGPECNYHVAEKELLSIIHCLTKFRTYLIGNKFTIITDNKALTFLNKCHLTSSRMMRWVLAIQEFNFDVVHCRGKENIVADILSRIPEDMDETTEVQENLEINQMVLKLSKATLKQIQQISVIQNKDMKLKNIIDDLTNNDGSKYKENYLYEKNTLYRKVKRQWKLYIPEEMRRSLLLDMHNTYGHGGIRRTLEIFKESFTTDQLLRTTKDIVRRCDLCQRCKDNEPGLHGETAALVPEQKGHLVSMDYYGPLVTSTSGVKYILVIVDNFTKFVKLFALKRATTCVTLTRVQQYSEEHGVPRAILTDNGTQFTTKKWKQGLQKLNIKPKLTAIRNPCTNLAERINRQLGNLFRLYVRGAHTGWARHLKLIETCINESFHETIRMTPHQAHYGRPPARSWIKHLDSDVMVDGEEVDTSNIYLRIKEKRQREADKMNEKTKITTFDIGDKVLLRTNPISDALNKVVSKFCDLYSGPFCIKERVGNATYVLSPCEDPEQIRGTFNIRQLRKYYE